MSDTLPRIPTEVRSFEVRCKIGQFVLDGADADRAPDLVAVGGTVTIEPDLRKPVRINSDDPLDTRVVGVNGIEFQIDAATGRLVHPDGEPGVELVDPSDPHLDPQGWTYTATVRPAVGRPWSVTFGAPPDGASVVNIGGLAGVDISPGTGGNPVQQVVAARDEARVLSGAAEDAASRARASATNADKAATYAAEVAYGQPLEVTDATMAAVTSDTASSTRAALNRSYRTAISVKDFGAVGNGTHDDTAAIQAAEAAAAADRNSALYFPTGTYKFTHTITATAVFGRNRQKTILQYVGAGDAVGNGGAIMYHRKFESFTLRGQGTGIGLNLDSSPAGSYRNMIVQDFETGILLDGTGASDALYNIFDDVTVQSTVTGVKIRGLSHENRFTNFRINFATTGVEIVDSGRNVFMASAIENCVTGMHIREEHDTQKSRSNTVMASRFEFCTTNVLIEPEAEHTSLLMNRYISGALIDNGKLTMNLDNTDGYFKAQGVKVKDVLSNAVTAALGKFATIANPTDYTRSRVQLADSGTIADRNAEGAGWALRVNLANPAATGAVLDVQRAGSTVVRVANQGHLAIRSSTAPVSGAIATGEAQFWIDTTNGAARLGVVAKQADGKVVTGSIPLAVAP